MLDQDLLKQLYGCYQKDLQLYQEWAALSAELINEIQEWDEGREVVVEPDWAKITEFGQARERMMEALQIGTAKSVDLRERVCRELGVEEFRLGQIGNYVSDQEKEAWQLLIDALIRAVHEAQAFDANLVGRLEEFLAETKSDLLQVQTGSKLRQAYLANEVKAEPRFIDKNK